jgi:Ran GTPase-activating protein (RanGAP) involved in mRNA processing and transport
MRSLTHLEFCNFKFSSLEVCRLFATTFSSLASIQNLNLSNSIDIDCFKELAPALANMKSMTRLELRNNWIPESACTALVAMLTSMPLLTHLDLKNNRLGSGNHFDLTKNRFGSEMVPALSTLKNLTYLDLSANQIRAIAIAPVFSVLEHLQLRHNSLGCLGMCDLVPALSSMCSLRHLDLQNACIGVDGSVELAIALETLPGLTHLNLRKNFIGDDGCIALATAFSSMMSLTHLDLHRNEISAGGCEALEPALYSMLELLHLNLSHNPCSDADHEDSRLLLVVAASTAQLSVTFQFN